MPDLTDAEKELSSLDFKPVEIFRLREHLKGKELGYFIGLAVAVFDLGIKDDAAIKAVMGTIISGEATIETYQQFIDSGFAPEHIMGIIEMVQGGMTVEQITEIYALAARPGQLGAISDIIGLLSKHGVGLDEALEKMADPAALLNQAIVFETEALQSTVPAQAEVSNHGKTVSAAVPSPAARTMQS